MRKVLWLAALLVAENLIILGLAFGANALALISTKYMMFSFFMCIGAAAFSLVVLIGNDIRKAAVDHLIDDKKVS